MKKFLLGMIVALVITFIYRSCSDTSRNRSELRSETGLIREQLRQVSKLVVTEGHFSEVYSYKDSRELFGSLLRADKKALVVVNAEVSIAYDLNALEYELDSLERKISIRSIPEPEIRIDPDLEYYDIQADYLNPFVAGDYNQINAQVRKRLRSNIESSDLLENAEERLMSELSKFYILSNSLGWKLVMAPQDQMRLDDYFKASYAVPILKP